MIALVQLLVFFEIPSSTSSVTIVVKFAYFEGSLARRSCNLCKYSTDIHHAQLISYMNNCNVESRRGNMGIGYLEKNMEYLIY
jgi:hypothetical protein